MTLLRQDNLRNVTTSGAAILIVGYGMYSLNHLVDTGRLDATAWLAIIGPLIGGVATWLFSKDAQAATRATIERATQQAQTNTGNGTTVNSAQTTVQGGSPTNVTVADPTLAPPA